MLKILGSVAVILSGAMLGAIKREELKRRERELEDFYLVLEEIENEFKCLKSSLPNALERVLPRCKTNVYGLIEAVLTRLKSAEGVRAATAWKDALGDIQLSITKEDYAVFEQFGNGLNGADFDSQLKNITYVKQKLSNCIAEAQQSRKTNGKLALQLGTFGGITIVLLLV